MLARTGPAIIAMALAGATLAQTPPPGPARGSRALPPLGAGAPLQVDRDLVYRRDGASALHLDLYRRDHKDKAPARLVVWLHGEGPFADKSPSPAARLVAAGYAVASVEYRDAATPVAVADVRAAVRWLRGHAADYGFDAAHIGLWGYGRGGTIAAMVATTRDAGDDAIDPAQSARVEAVVDFAGPAEPGGPGAGGPIAPDSPPFLIVHGTADTAVSPRASEALQIALKHADIDDTLDYVVGAGHDFDDLSTPAEAEAVTAFFDRTLRDGLHQRDEVATVSEPGDVWIDTFPDRQPGTRFGLYATPTRGPGTRASYRIYLPPGYDAAGNARRRYPVIYYLHGFGDDSRKAYNAGYVARLDAAQPGHLMPAAIVVIIQAPNRGGYVDAVDGNDPIETVLVRDLITHIDGTYRTVATREGRAIEGHSMGGAGALHLAFKYPELFASVASFSAALHPAAIEPPDNNAMLVNTRFGGDPGRAEAEGAWSLVVKNADHIRGRMAIRMVCGDKDDLLVANRWMSDLLDREHIAHDFVIAHGAPHSIKEVLARLDENPFGYYAKVFARYVR